jgi:hypothetical protein
MALSNSHLAASITPQTLPQAKILTAEDGPKAAPEIRKSRRASGWPLLTAAIRSSATRTTVPR